MKVYKYKKHSIYSIKTFIKMSYVNSKIYFNNNVIRLISLGPYFKVYHLILFNRFKIVFLL